MKNMLTKKMSINVAVLFLLIAGLCVTSFALVYMAIKVEDNIFRTGEIEIDLNNGQPIITAEEFLFEPGMTVEKPFYIQNNGTWDVYYQLYFAQVDGNLGDVLDVTIFNEEGQTLLTGKLSALTYGRVPTVEDVLMVRERHDLTIRFHFPEEAGNEAQSGYLTFILSAVAVQTKNNPDKEFSYANEL
jgi:hypothetical protein